MEILQKCPMLRLERGYYVLTEKITVAIKHRQTIIDFLFTGVVMALLTMGILCIGCDLEIEQIVNNFKRPIPLLIGLACQIVYLPLLSALISKIFRLDHSTNLGLLSTTSSPGKFIIEYLVLRKHLFSGGASSNIYTALLAGDVDLSIIMTFFSTVSAFGTFPLWIWLLGKNYIAIEKIKFPWWSMFLSLITLFTPAIIGLLLRKYRPVLAYRIGRFLNPIAVGK
jgi:predicted Na+-dependent transporter